MKCPYCEYQKTQVIDTSHDQRGGTRRRRQCKNCGERFSSYERPVLATPLLIKKDKTREEFNREKLLVGLRVACAKRPISAADIENIAGEIEGELQQMGRAEVNSRVVGDLAIKPCLHAWAAFSMNNGHAIALRKSDFNQKPFMHR